MSRDKQIEKAAREIYPYDPQPFVEGAQWADKNPKSLPTLQDLSTCQKNLALALEEMEYFISCVEKGSIKSNKTYNRFKTSIKKIKS